MKITFLLPHVRLSGGVKAVFEYANRLRQRGHETLLAFPAPPVKWYRLGEKFRGMLRASSGGEHLAPQSVDWFPNRVPILRLPGLGAVGALPDADILVATAWETAEAVASAGERKGKKIYFVQHHEILWTRNRERAEKSYRLPFAKWIVISGWLRDILEREYARRAEVLVTPVDDQVFYRAEGKARRVPPLRVCLMHHDYDWKGYADGMQAIREARSRGCAVEPVVFGEKLIDPAPLFAQAGFEFEYHFRPTGGRLREIYSSCDVYLCPSWHEGLGMPPMEAMACGCALVTCDTGGGRDYALHEDTALVSPPRDTTGLARSLERVAGDAGLRQRLAERGREHVSRFRWDENCARLEKVFSECLLEPKP